MTPDYGSRRQVAAWLLLCCALVFAMVVVGGVTRLTHSGLSMVEWKPLVGTIPPLDQAQWETVFHKYQATPEYQQVNRGMTLVEFKGIFWWEYFHRLLGRAVGVAFALPLLYFLLRRKIDAALALKLAGIFLLGGLQGAMGWYMVQSGLVDDPRVSQFRLTAHLGIALLILAAMLWIALGILHPRRAAHGAPHRRLGNFAVALAALIFLMALSGGFVAGIRAGFAYNTFPLMNGHLIPPEILSLEPWWRNLFSNMATVQFNHRMIAWLLMLLVPAFWIAARRVPMPPRARLATHALLGMLVIQVALGISTLLLGVPVPLAAAHQGGAVLLLCAALWSSHELRAASR
ncbi:MAG TPA: COX15/CtaA family protein [Burkholderiales bacterium]|nr:COX15/CtaA family protein [Burkholderiales bacterium]